jgi:hypothetical protein
VTDFPLKRIPPDGVPQALERAQRYRFLNDPAQAESIYRDVLAVEEGSQAALRGLVLALTDQFGGDHAGTADREVRDLIGRLDDAYDRAYFTGLLTEREIRAYLRRPGVARGDAYRGFRDAMAWYERAEALRPPGNADATLRWNSCVRTIEYERLEPEEESRELPLE